MGGSSLTSDHGGSACAVALPGPPGEKPFPATPVSAKIRPHAGLTVANDQSAGRGAVPGAPGRTREAWNNQDRMANAPVDHSVRPADGSGH
jgi:hypothetical protein